jgi:hypothetical protein
MMTNLQVQELIASWRDMAEFLRPTDPERANQLEECADELEEKGLGQ